MKKIFALLTILSILLVAAAGCGGSGSTPSPSASSTPKPKATYSAEQPDISNPDGEMLGDYGGSPAMEGAIQELTDTTMKLKVQGEVHELKLNDAVKKAIEHMKNDKGYSMAPGTMVIVNYSENDGVKTAEKISYLKVN